MQLKSPEGLGKTSTSQLWFFSPVHPLCDPPASPVGFYLQSVSCIFLGLTNSTATLYTISPSSSSWITDTAFQLFSCSFPCHPILLSKQQSRVSFEKCKWHYISLCLHCFPKHLEQVLTSAGEVLHDLTSSYVSDGTNPWLWYRSSLIIQIYTLI